MNPLQIARIVFGLLPAIRDGIIQIEKALPGKGKGELKLVMLREIIEEILKVTGNGAIMNIVGGVINRIVARLVENYNKDGWPEEEPPTGVN